MSPDHINAENMNSSGDLDGIRTQGAKTIGMQLDILTHGSLTPPAWRPLAIDNIARLLLLFFQLQL